MKSKLLPGSEKRAMWLMAPSTEAYLYQMDDGSGRVVYLPNFPGNMGGPASYAGNGRLLNIEVEVNQYAASHGSAGDLILVDPAAYAWGERQDIEIGVSEHVAFLSNLLTWRFLFRGDGRSKINTYLTLQNGDTVSPFVFRAA
jgi:HK97 family phage major capsid protein